MHSWRLIHRCASACLAFVLVLSGFVLSRAGDGRTDFSSLDTVVSEPQRIEQAPGPKAEEVPQPEPDVQPSPAPAPTPDEVERAKPVVKVQQTAVPEAHPDSSQSDLVAELPATGTGEFGMVGVTWSATSSADGVTVQVRTRTDGRWSAWEELEVESDSDPEGRDGTDPLWVGSSNGVAARVTSKSGSKPDDIKIATVDPGTAGADANAVTPALFSATAQAAGTTAVQQTADGAPKYTSRPAIVKRSTWGASAGTPCDTPIAGNTTKGIVIHHTAGSNSYAKSQSAAIVRATQAYHVKGRNWCDIGYNFLVDKYGQIFEGRRGGVDRAVRAAHSGNLAVNTYTLGVSMMGNLDKVPPSAAMKDSMVRLIGWRTGTTYMPAKGTYGLGGKTLNKIAGHRNVVSTGCPGKYGYAWLSAKGGLRDRVATYIAHYSSPIKTLAARLGASTTGPVFIGEAPAGVGRRTQFGKRNLFWSQATGAHAVWGKVLTEYKRLGLQASKLGFPSGDYTVSADKKTGTQRFARGYIRYTASTKKAVTHVGTTTPAPSTAPARPTGLKAVPTSSGATLSWSAAKNAKQYSVCLLTSGTTTKCSKVVNSLKTTRTVVNGLKPTGGTDWYFKVRSINGTLTAWSGKVGFNLKAAAAPADNVTVPSSRSFVLKGHGYGHGIGMSQYGAQYAAIRGASHGAIIRYYYPGTTLTGVGNKAIRVLISKDTSSSVDIRRASGGSLVFRNTKTGKRLVLPTSVRGVKATRWRIIPDPAKRTQSLLQVSAGGWKNYDKPFTANGQFESSRPIGLVLPDSSTVKYRGVLRSAIPKAGSKVRDTVNVLGIDDYTRGVVAAEMPSSWRQSALRAQSAAARTYGYRSVKAGGYYDICDTTSCQVYRGVSVETANTDAAVAATSNRVITYQGKPAFTQFSSSSGGYSAAGSQPYLKQKVDKYDDWSGNGVHDWTVTVKAATLEKAYSTIGTLKTLKVTDRTDVGEWGGRIISLRLTGSKGTKTITGNEARFALGLRSSWFRFN